MGPSEQELSKLTEIAAKTNVLIGPVYWGSFAAAFGAFVLKP